MKETPVGLGLHTPASPLPACGYSQYWCLTTRVPPSDSAQAGGPSVGLWEFVVFVLPVATAL